MDIRDRYRGALIGEAAGDALGYTVEFLRRGNRRGLESQRRQRFNGRGCGDNHWCADWIRSNSASLC